GNPVPKAAPRPPAQAAARAAGDRPAQPLRAGGDGGRRVPLRLDPPSRGDTRGPGPGGGGSGAPPGGGSRGETLIRGGAGFRGSHLCERALAEGHEVVCVDNLVTGRLENV